MTERFFDAVVVGAGAAGLSVAAEIARHGHSVALLDRENTSGGILNQCIHNGFGVHHYKEELTGPEFAARLIALIENLDGIELCLGTTVLDTREEGEEKFLYAVSRDRGVTKFVCRAVVLAMGCRERNRGNTGIPGTRPSGILTAGFAQRLVNLEGYIPGRDVVIVGSGDIGLIMARRMTWVGARVHGVIERKPYPSGLARNVAQCLTDFRIPLYLSHIISEIHGRDRIEAVSITPLDGDQPNPDRTFRIVCDTLLLSVGLVPDNDLSRKLGVRINPETHGPFVDGRLMTSRPGIFACGNVLHVHDLVDFATEEAIRCGEFASEYLERPDKGVSPQYFVRSGANVKYVVPNSYVSDRDNIFYLRPMIAKERGELLVTLDGEQIMKKRLPRLQPSEMISFRLGPANLRDVNADRHNLIEVNVG
ncbi:MAG TPA: FAD-dependent oxidoreductase [Spirochaetia bacterium]|nr:FAD-dependent oxidoreductase [Spirochaetia bacterium]